MNLRQLRTFVYIADAGGIARAGSRLNLSQPAASRQILALEADLGVRLFDRSGRRFCLTSEGEDLLRQSRRLLMDADSLGARARALKGGDTGILRVGATPMAVESTLSPFLARYRRRHPGVEVHFVEDGGIRLLDLLDDGDIHLGLIVPDERFQSRPLYPVYDIAVLWNKHRLSRRRTLDVNEIAQEPLLLLHRSFGSRQWFEAACSAAHIRPRVLMESAAPHSIIALAAVGYGIAVVPSTAVVPSGGVRAVPLLHRGAPVGKPMTIAWHPQRTLAPYAERFVEELAAYCRGHYPGRKVIRRAPSRTKANSGPRERP